MSKRVSTTLYLVIALITSIPAIMAQDAPTEKTDLINKFILISGAKEQFEQVQMVVQNQIKQSIIEAIRRNPKVQNIPENKRQELLNIITTSVTSFNKKFVTELTKAISFDDAVEKIYLPVYANKFTDQELTEIIAFYESAAGQKFVQITPNLMQESAIKMNKEYGQTINEISQKIAKEEFAGISSQIDQLAATPATPSAPKVQEDQATTDVK